MPIAFTPPAIRCFPSISGAINQLKRWSDQWPFNKVSICIMSCQKFIGIFANISACLNLPIFAVSHSWEGALICSAIAMAVLNVIAISGMLTECFEWNGVDPVADRLWFFFFFLSRGCRQLKHRFRRSLAVCLVHDVWQSGRIKAEMFSPFVLFRID